MINRPTRQRELRAPRRVKALGRAHARLALCLTERDRWILRMCHEHRVLTTPQLTALTFGSPSRARRRLAALHDYGVLDRFRPLRAIGTAPTHWVLAPTGAAVLAAQAGIELRELGFRPDRALAVAHSLHLAHTIGVNEWFITLASAARATGNAALLAWWSENRCRALWGDLVIPDGYGRYTQAGATLDFFLEFDLATMALPTVAGKLHGYAELARTSGVITPVLVWVPLGSREAAARKALRDTWAGLRDPEAVPVATAAADLLPIDPAASPAAPVWLSLDSTDGTRVTLPELAARWPRVTPAPASVPVAPHSRYAVLTPPPPCPPPEAGER
ncbi:replication-relaxation family protein [Nocardia otitidiscaviarum]|uniref:replication-relaxation family protein n=1 Tax=Nocardia otitidiscaviarum TaxID=1823 RepID=UPI001893D096|nr:replication-relaxation family protein [Nocardia otitidiscaviarum]MBF6183363.1 replication-relaxation family protein [Nocardia otitidiscaviarum]